MSATPDSFAPTQPPARVTALALREATMLQTGLLRDTAAETPDDSLDIKALLRVLNKTGTWIRRRITTTTWPCPR